MGKLAIRVRPASANCLRVWPSPWAAPAMAATTGSPVSCSLWATSSSALRASSPLPGCTASQGYFLGGNRRVCPDRRTRPACGRAKGGGGDCQRQCEVGPAPEGQNCRSGGRVMRKTEAAGVWRERWRRAMRVPRRGRGWVQVPPGSTCRRRVLKSGPGVGRSPTQAHR